MKQPIAMKWETSVGPYIRPIQWICAMLDKTIIPMEIYNVTSSNRSFGHRFLTKTKDGSYLGKEIKLKSVLNYEQDLKKNYVIANHNERKEIINNALKEHIEPTAIDQSLLNEVNNLVEYPEVICIEFPKQFLALPKEVLIECIKKHQKAFIVPKKNALTNSIAIVADSVTKTNKQSIIDGNKRVILARLNDVQFFWDTDIKNGSFINWNKQLESIIFQNGCGSIAEKVDRMSHLCHTIGDQISIKKNTQDIIDRAVHRCKADLVTQLVNEIPKLQGIIGGYYSIAF